jgi:hypothetical protein
MEHIMAEQQYLRRTLCPAEQGVAFESQLPIYIETHEGGGKEELTLRRVGSANIGVVEGMLVADFTLPEALGATGQDVAIVSLIAAGERKGAGPAAVRITGITISGFGADVAERGAEWSDNQYKNSIG